MRDEGAAEEEDAGDVGVIDSAPFFEAEFVYRFSDVDAGVVDENVDAAEAREDAVAKFGDGGFVGDVGLEAGGLGTGGFDELGNIGHGGFVAGGEGDVDAFSGEGEGHGFTEAAAASGDDGGFAF